MTIRAFFNDHIKLLGQFFQISVLANFKNKLSEPLSEGVVHEYDIAIDRKINLITDIKAFIALYSHYARHKYDLVHSVTPKAGLLAMTAAWLAKVPVRVHTFTGQVWVTQHGIKRRLLKLMDCIISMMATDILVDSWSQRQFLIKENVVSHAKSKVLANGSISGVDINRFTPSEDLRKRVRQDLEIEDSDKVFLFLGRLNKDKGVIDLAYAFSLISAKRPDTRLLIIGPDEDGMLKKISEVCSNCSSRVHFIDFTSEPNKFMAAADIFCLPSYREGFGSVIIEAASSGIPAIGSRIYGISDAIEDGVTGMLFEAGNSNDLARKMLEMLENINLRLQMGINARKRAIKLFKSDIVSQSLVSYYETLLSGYKLCNNEK
jgi:glycosyltransferase involved in cell wall biosynthesis